MRISSICSISELPNNRPCEFSRSFCNGDDPLFKLPRRNDRIHHAVTLTRCSDEVMDNMLHSGESTLYELICITHRFIFELKSPSARIQFGSAVGLAMDSDCSFERRLGDISLSLIFLGNPATAENLFPPEPSSRCLSSTVTHC